MIQYQKVIIQRNALLKYFALNHVFETDTLSIYNEQLNTLGIYTNAGGDTAFVTNIKTENNFLTEDYVLYQNYPNPFNPKTIISYELETSSSVSILSLIHI